MLRFLIRRVRSVHNTYYTYAIYTSECTPKPIASITMKLHLAYWAIVLFVLFSFKPIDEHPTIFLCGDSTMATKLVADSMHYAPAQTDYRNYLIQFMKEVQLKSGNPLLMTPVNRHNFVDTKKEVELSNIRYREARSRIFGIDNQYFIFKYSITSKHCIKTLVFNLIMF